MTILARLLPRRLCSRRPVFLSVLISIAALALLGAAPAGALVVTVEGTKVGVQPRETARYWEAATVWRGDGSFKTESNPAARQFNNNLGLPVMHSLETYAIYWDPQDFYHGDWQEQIDGFLANAAGDGGHLTNVFAVDAQYTDASNVPASTNSLYRGAYTDTFAYPKNGCTDPSPPEFESPITEGIPVCLTDAQLRTELSRFVAEHGLRKGLKTIYYLLTPPGVTVCLDAGGTTTGHCSDHTGTLEVIENEIKAKEEAEAKKEAFTESEEFKSYLRSFCSYHGIIGGGNEGIVYASVPWSAGDEGRGRGSIPGYDCQDGGFGPGKSPTGEIETKEVEGPETLLEKEEFEKKNPQEKREAEEAKALKLGGPHQQEPNQLSERGPDGTFDHGLADLIINQVAVEQLNAVPNPELNAWQDTLGREVTDECRNFFAPKLGGSVSAKPTTRAGTLSNQAYGTTNYYINDAYNYAAERLPYPGVPCLHGVALQPKFTSPSPVNSGEIVGFNGMESNISLDAAVAFSEGSPSPNYAIYTWNFGDGSPTVTGFAPGAPACSTPWLSPCAAAEFHSYQYGGTYEVTLTVRDVGGHVATISHPVTVIGPPPPSSGGSGGSGGSGPSSPSASSGGSAGGSAGRSSGGAGGAAGSSTKPVASDTVLSRKFRPVSRNGVVVRYAVNQQVAGRFEVMLGRTLARRLGISGASASGLPAGSAPAVVIGKAIIVTQKGGRGTIHIMLSKRTNRRLARLRSATMMLRFFVRNAARVPASTSVLSTFTLKR